MLGEATPYTLTHQIHARTLTFRDLFGHGDLGLIVPHQHHQFVWSDTRVSQFVGDVCRCVLRLRHDHSAMHCFGSVTLAPGYAADPLIPLLDSHATPQNVLALVDGQQRFAALALLATRLYYRLYQLRPVALEGEGQALLPVIDQQMEALLNLCSFQLRSGFPRRKPVLIHGRLDSWRLKDVRSETYRSAVSSYLSQFLYSLETDPWQPPTLAESSLAAHIDRIERWLTIITTAGTSGTEAYITPWQVRSEMHELEPHLFAQPLIAVAVASPEASLSPEARQVRSLVLLWSFVYTLLYRCCVVVITPTRRETAQVMLDTRRRELALEYAE